MPSFVAAVTCATLLALLSGFDDARGPSVDPTSDALEILERRCFSCHGPDARRAKGGLRMTGRDALVRGGDRGPAVVPGDADASLLIAAIRYGDESIAMPPRSRMPDEEIAVVERWIQAGAPWKESEAAPAPLDTEPGPDLESGRAWWAFQPIVAPPVPTGDGLPAHPIDAFLQARLASAGIPPRPRAGARQLVRRAAFDLTGLPPSLADVERYEREVRELGEDAAWAALVDRYLRSPEYGVRWARHWLDVVRYAQTNGYERDTEKPYAWRYRDYVVDSLNADKPFDRFVLEQLAGDELPDRSAETLVATGLYRLGAWDDEPDDAVQAEFDELDDSLRVISEGFLGLTVGCARCHDHEFDPITQEDYYSLLAFVRNVRRYEDPRYAPDSATMLPFPASGDSPQRFWEDWNADRDAREQLLRDEIGALMDRGSEPLRQKRSPQLRGAAREALRTPFDERTTEQWRAIHDEPLLQFPSDLVKANLPEPEARRARALTEELGALPHSYPGTLDWTLGVREAGGEPAETHVLLRGLASVPGKAVEPRFPAVLSPPDAGPPPIEPPRDATSSGRRTALAEWIASPENPLTARVLVNRVWQQHFGRGIVESPNDFGRTGRAPTHPELLDWLAADFIQHGWSMKHLHRRILGSEAWRRSSRVEGPGAALDPANELLWRQELRRLDAEAVRDSILLVSGRLHRERGGRGFFPEISRAALGGMSKPGQGWERSDDEQRSRRSLYAFAMRGLPNPLLETFDCPNASLPVGRRSSTTQASQSMALLNGDFANEQARALASRVLAEEATDPIGRLYELALARRPSTDERRIAEAYLEEQAAAFAELPREVRFRPKVPARIADTYLAQLEGRDMLYGPTRDWRYARGLWGGSYNYTRQQDAVHGPAALFSPIGLGPVQDSALSARVVLAHGCESASLLVRARIVDEVAQGWELALLPEAGRVELRALHPPGTEPEVLASAAAPVHVETPLDLRIEASGPTIRAWLGEADTPLLEHGLSTEPTRGSFGVRVVGDALRLQDASVRSGGRGYPLRPDDNASGERRAFDSLCLLVLNLNEFLHVE